MRRRPLSLSLFLLYYQTMQSMVATANHWLSLYPLSSLYPCCFAHSDTPPLPFLSLSLTNSLTLSHAHSLLLRRLLPLLLHTHTLHHPNCRSAHSPSLPVLLPLPCLLPLLSHQIIDFMRSSLALTTDSSRYTVSVTLVQT